MCRAPFLFMSTSVTGCAVSEGASNTCHVSSSNRNTPSTTGPVLALGKLTGADRWSVNTSPPVEF